MRENNSVNFPKPIELLLDNKYKCGLNWKN